MPRNVRMRGKASGSAQVIQALRDVNVSAEPSEYYLASLPVAPVRLSPEHARRQPSRLLAARRRVVEFTGRGEQLSGLADWRDGPERAAVRLTSGSAGQGKTRLSEHFARVSAEAGWQVRVAYPRGNASAGMDAQEALQPEDADRLLILVDYAERWVLDRLLHLISGMSRGKCSRVRFLLMARPVGLWWYGLSHRLEDTLEMAADVMQLPDLATSPDERLNAFTRARDCFAEALDVPEADAVNPPGTLSDDAYGVALTIHMAALAALDAHIRAGTAPEDPGRLSEYLLRRELVHWQELHGRSGELPVIDANTMGRAVFAASLTGPHLHAQGTALIERAGLSREPSVTEQILDAHAVCYPPPDPALVLEPLYPDRLAEDFVALLTPGHPHAYPADAWTVTAVRRLLRSGDSDDGGASLPYAKQALAVMIETAARWEHFATAQLYPLLRGQPELALSAGGAALITLARFPHLDPDMLEALAPHLSGNDVDLALGAAALTERLAEYRLADTPPDRAEQAQLHLILGIRQGVAGLEDQAITSLQKAVTLFRDLPASQAYASSTDLASALLNLGISQLSIGHYPAAVASLQEAASHFERALPDETATAGEGLATTLDRLEIAMSHTGDNRGALELARLVVKIWRRRPRTDNESSAEYARALLNLGNRLATENGRDAVGEAMMATEEALGIFRPLAADDPGAYSPDLARALGNWSQDLARAGREKEAIAAITESVALYRAMATTNPAAFQGNYGKVLYNLGALLGNAGRYREAYDTTREALAVLQSQYGGDSSVNQAIVAITLIELATWLANLNNADDAVVHAREALALCRRLGPAHSVTDRQHAAHALSRLGLELARRRKWPEAVEAADAAAEMYHRLAMTDPSFAEEAWTAAQLRLMLRAAVNNPRLRGVMGAAFRTLPYRGLAKRHRG